MRRGAIVILLLLAVAVRTGLVLAEGAGRPPAGDERGYAAVAGSLARGDGFGFVIDGASTEGVPVVRRLLAYRAPLLPLLLAPVHGATGGNPAALRLWVALLGALAAPLAAGVAVRVAGDARVGWMAGLAVVFWPAHVWLSARILSEPVASVLLLAAVDLVLRRRHARAGLALGLALLCRPGLLPTVLLLAVAAAVVEQSPRRWRAGLAIAGVSLALLSAWAVRNAVVLGRPLLVSSAGVTLLGGNSEAALAADPPGQWRPPEVAWRKPDPPDLGMYGWSRLDEAASDARFRDAAVAWVRAEPLAAARLAVHKVLRLLDPDTRSEHGDAGRKALLGWLTWGPALLLLAVGLARGLRAREPAALLAAAVLGGHLALAVVAYGDARMRAPMVPVLLALVVAPCAASAWRRWIRPRARDTVDG